MSFADRRFLVCPSLAIAFLSSLFIFEPSAHAQALRKFEEAHESKSNKSSSSSSSSSSTSSSSSSSSSSDSDSDSDHSLGAAFARVLFEPLVRGMGYLLFHPNGYDSVDENGRPGEDSETPSEPNAYPAATIYRTGKSSPYVYFPSRLDENGNRRDFGRPRTSEFSLGGFMNIQEPVYSHDINVRRWWRLVDADLGWERFYEPRKDIHSTDTLDMVHLRVGINILGPHVEPVELYAIVGGTGMIGFGDMIPAFDIGIEARAYPLRPLVFYDSTVVSIFGNGPPLIDERLEAGISVGRFDFRAGLRGLKQEPAQSFFGPVATIAMRL